MNLQYYDTIIVLKIDEHFEIWCSKKDRTCIRLILRNHRYSTNMLIHSKNYSDNKPFETDNELDVATTRRNEIGILTEAIIMNNFCKLTYEVSCLNLRYKILKNRARRIVVLYLKLLNIMI